MYIAGPYRRTQRLAGVVTTVSLKYPHLLTPHFTALVKALRKPDAAVAFKRNTIRLFQFVPIPKRMHGQMIAICFDLLHDNKETIAVNVFAMTVLEQLTRDHQDIRRELMMIIEDQLPHAGPAFRSRGVKVLRRLRGTLPLEMAARSAGK